MEELYGEYIPNKKIVFGGKESPPNVFASGDYLLQFCGSLNNTEELQNVLRLDDIRDEEIIIELFKHYDPEKAIQLLDGAFAFALFDKKKEKLFLTRDRMAHIPLYYTKSNNKTIFSTSINKILKNSLKREFDIEGVLINLSSNKWTNPERTHINGIYNIEHGTYMECNENVFLKKTYHSYYTNLKYDEIELLPEFGKNYEKNIAQNLKAYKNLSVSLSGGLDSSLVVQSILRQLIKLRQKERLKAYTIKYSGENEHTDLEYARLLAREKNFSLEEVVLGGDNFDLRKIDELLLIIEQIPFDPTSMGDWLIRSRAKKDGKDVLFTGNGSDELWGGYGGVCQSRIFDNADMDADSIVKSYLNTAFFGSKWNDKIYDIANYALRETIQEHLINHLRNDKYNALAIYAIKTILNYNNTQEYHFAKSLGIDIRMPFIDSNTLALLPFTTSGSSKIKDGKAKYFIRKYAETQSLLSRIVNRRKFPYPDPKDPEGSVNNKVKKICEENWKAIINSPIINTIIKSECLRNSTAEHFNYRELWMLLVLWRVEELFKLDTKLLIEGVRRPSKMPYVCDFLEIPNKIENKENLVNKQKTTQLGDIPL